MHIGEGILSLMTACWVISSQWSQVLNLNDSDGGFKRKSLMQK